MSDIKKTASVSKAKPVLGGKVIPTTTGRGKHFNTDSNDKSKKWGKFKATVIDTKMKSLYKIMPKIPKKSNQGVNSEEPEEKKGGWLPVNTIETIGGPENIIQQEIEPQITEMDRKNSKVVEGPASSIQLSIDKSKGLVIEKEMASPKPKEESEAATPGPSGPNLQLAAASDPPTPAQRKSLPTPAYQGRMTASSFMKQQSTKLSYLGNFPYIQPFNIPRVTGIPKSFLTEKHQRQLQGTPNQQQQTQAPGQGPIWEEREMETWPPAQPHNQSGQTIGQGAQTFSHGAQTFGQSAQTFGQPAQSFGQGGQPFGQGGQGFAQTGQSFGQGGHFSQSSPVDHGGPGTSYGDQIYLNMDDNVEQPKQQYSPSDPYGDVSINEGNNEDRGGSPDSQQSASKRLSAFKRLGPVTQPKKPKLTINLLFNKEQAVREVVDQSDQVEVDKYSPAYLKPEILTSLDDTVMNYLVFWPWKKPLAVRRTVTVRHNKSAMLAAMEQMEGEYHRDSAFFQVSVIGYPASWSKEDVMDAVLENVEGKSFIPCFIEFSKTECKFLVIRCHAALTAIHKTGFVIRKNEAELTLSIMVVTLTVYQLDFIPRLVLRKRLAIAMEGETEINLKQFTTTSDVSHFVYFPLNRVANQYELMRLQSSVPWETLTKLVLSHNRITSLSGFELQHYTPHLRHLDVSHNHLSSVTSLLPCRGVPLQHLVLEGNPLCTDYTDPDRYTTVLKMMFSGLRYIDGVPVSGGCPWVRNHCPGEEAARVVRRVLEVLFPLLDAPRDQRAQCEHLYDVNATLTLTYMYKLRYSPIYKDYRSLFFRARIMDEGEMNSVEGAVEIAKLVDRWPILHHDPHTFTVDVMYHTDTTTILRISGIVKVTAETLAEDEHLLFFTRTLVLHSIDTVEYKITNEMIYWDLPEKERAMEAFQMTTIKNKSLSLKLDNPPDEDLKEKLLEIFMTLTELERKPSERCLESKEWHLKNALEYFTKLLKLDNLDPLYFD